MLLHGQPGAGSDFDAVATLLPPGLRTLQPDRPGYRSNPLPPSDFRANAVSILAEMDAAGVERATVVGHSYGGGVALAMLDLAPHRVDALVLVSSVGPNCLNGWDALLAAPVTGPFCSLFAWSFSPWIARTRLALIARWRGRAIEPGEFVNWATWAAARHRHGAMWRTFLIEQRALVSDIEAVAARVAGSVVPTMIVADPGDTMVPVRTSHALYDLLPNSELTLVDGGGHHLPLRRPDVVAAAIIDLTATLLSAEPA